ncbi:MAG: glycosyltransferase family 9 protein [Gammaproteobacteria bacterium]|nr:glycosyltransferase family 9 protein [Gammaproteobacteria bacterium]
MASPLIRMLRDTYPQAHIAWLVQDEGADLLSANPDLDEVMILPRRHWHELWQHRHWLMLAREIIGFTITLRKRQFDTALDLQGLLKSAIWARLSKARQRLGLQSREGSGMLMTRLINAPRDDYHIGSEYRHLADRLGLKGAFTMHIALSNNDDQYGYRAKVSFGPYIVLCPFTTRPQKHWFDDYWVQLVRLLRNKKDLIFIMLGGPGDRLAAQKILDRNDLDIVDMTGHTSLRQAAALIHYAELLVGVDTGLTHMGIALNTPTIALFGSTCPYQETDKDNVKVLYKKLDCSPCRRRPTCNAEYTCMRSLKPTDVAMIAQELLEFS